MRNDVGAEYQSVEAALDLARADGRAPNTIADTADNTGGGAPGDSTFFLARCSTGVSRTCARTAVRPDGGRMQDGGLGAHLRLRIGGKLGPESGAPVDIDCTVIGLSNRVVQMLNGGPSSLGACAAIRIGQRLESASGGVEVMLTARRVQAGSPELFSGAGIETLTKRIIVKSMQHFHAGFAPISRARHHTRAMGALAANVRDTPYRRVNTSDFWPFNPAPNFGD